MKELPGKLLSVFGGGSGSPSSGFARNSTGSTGPVSVSEGGAVLVQPQQTTLKSSLEAERTTPAAPTFARGDDLVAFGSTVHIAQAAESQPAYSTSTPASPRSEAGGSPSNYNSVQGGGASGMMSAGNSAAQVGNVSAPQVQWMVRVNTRTQELCKYFNLPPEETLLDEFSCALRKRMLLQGRIYIFDHFVCFSSNLFGYTKTKVIPFQDLVAVRKKTHFRFPNSIEVEDVNGAKEFFTSFLSREDAYRLIMNCWSHCKANRQEAHSQLRNDGSATYGSALRSASSEMDGDKATTRSEMYTRMGADNGHDYENDDDDGEEEEEEGASSGMWQLQSVPVPAPHPDYKQVLKAALPGTPRDFYNLVLADEGHFFEDFLEKEGNRRINLTNWKRHEALGHVRDMQFTAPIKGAFGSWGVSSTQCYQSHRMSLYQPDHIVFESSQTMTDIPYGDCFTVDMRWDVEVDPASTPDNPSMLFTVLERTPFTRSCLFKKVIESGSYKQVQENYTNFVTMVRPVLQEQASSHNSVQEAQNSGTFSGTASGSPVPSSRSHSMAKNEAAYDSINARFRNRPTTDNVQTMDRSVQPGKAQYVVREVTPRQTNNAPVTTTSHAHMPFKPLINTASLLKWLALSLLFLVPLAYILSAVVSHHPNTSHAPGSVGWSLPANRSAAPAYPYQHQPMHGEDMSNSHSYPRSQHDRRRSSPQPDHHSQSQQQQQQQQQHRRHASSSDTWAPTPQTSDAAAPHGMQAQHSSAAGHNADGRYGDAQPLYELDSDYWASRLAVLQQELQLLSSRVNTVSSEVTLAMQQVLKAAHLQQQQQQKDAAQSTIVTPAPFATSPPFAESAETITSSDAGAVQIESVSVPVVVAQSSEVPVLVVA